VDLPNKPARRNMV